MASPRNFRTGLFVAHFKELARYKVAGPVHGAGWKVRFKRQEPDARVTIVHGREVVIEARSWLRAQQALNLVTDSLALLHGEDALWDSGLVVHNEREPAKPYEGRPPSWGVRSTEGVPLAVLCASKTSRRRQWGYAVANYNLSLKLYSPAQIDLDPHHALRQLKTSRFLDDHVTFAAAIVAAYSAIEDLGLEIRASREKPSTIGGKWNPAVREELEQRLVATKVSLDDPFPWLIRGPDTRIHRKRKLVRDVKAQWAAGPVRDTLVPIVDALAEASRLRSKVAAHGAKTETPSISPYDVTNVQHLARRLIMTVLGAWTTKRRHAR
jgi:hypothetical protein